MSTLYEVSSLIALVMNKPNMFSQVLGILNKGNQIDVISISKSWAYFKYNNINAYVKKGNLKILNTEPIESKGSVTLKYIDITTNNEIYPSETINNLNLGKYSYEARVLYNYKLQSNSTQSVNLTEEDPDQVIIFYYNKILGSITIKYIDKNVNTDIYEPKVIENLSLGTYTYGAINISGYVLSDNEIKTVTITETSPNATITFKYAEILGTVTIRYIDNSSYTELSEADTFTDLKLGNYSYTYKDIPGYSLASDSTQTVELTDDNHDVEIEFKYNELLGSITIKYIDSSSLNEIETATVISNLSLGTYSYSAKSFEGYEIIGDSSQSVTLNDSNLNAIISFNYSRISGSITIEYLDSSTLSEIAPSITISNIALGSYIYDAIYIDNYEIDGDSSISIVLTVSNPNQTISFKYNKIEIPDDLNWNEVPYISTYYIKPVVKPGEEVFIDYYITDYYYKEYVEEDYSETFTVTVRVESQNDKLYHYLKAGDHKVSLGSFNNEGEQKFSILCTDKYGRNSHELFNFFLVQGDIEIKEYIMTEDDLITYNIKNTDNYEVKNIIDLSSLTTKDITTVKDALVAVASNIIPESKTYVCVIADTDGDGKPDNWWSENQVIYADDYNKNVILKESTNTRKGLQQLLDDKKNTGYNKLKLLPGIYRIDHQQQIYIPTDFTLDMNGAILKQNQFTGNKSLMLDLNNTFNSHVINGIIEGDYFSHDYANSTNNSEWVNGINIGGESKYSSFENLIIKDITGYGTSNGIANSRDGKLNYTYLSPQSIGNIFKLGDIDSNTGLDIESTTRTTSDFINISSYEKVNYLSVSIYLGYQGNSCGTWNLICHFYNENKEFFKSIDSYQYRRIGIPKNSKYMRITILNESYPTNLSIQYFRVPTHCAFKNINLINCRCVGMAPAAMKDILFEYCKFTNCGQSSAKCAFDAEDGWDMMQDVTFISLEINQNPNNHFLACAGHNFIIENLTSGKIYIKDRANSFVIRNSENINTVYLGNITKLLSGYTRFYNNLVLNSISINNKLKSKLCIKNSKILRRADGNSYCLYKNCYIGPDEIPSTSSYEYGLGSAIYKNCNFKNLNSQYHYAGKYYNCTIENIFGYLQRDNSTTLFQDCCINNLNVEVYDKTNYLIRFINCTINSSKITKAIGTKHLNLSLYNCKVTLTSEFLKIPHYCLKEPISFENNSFSSTGTTGILYLYDNITGGSAGELVQQSTILLTNNTFTLPNSLYVVYGLQKNTLNYICIVSTNNTLLPTTLLLCNHDSKSLSNINIIED